MRRWSLFVAGVLMGIVGLVMLFTRSYGSLFWLLLTTSFLLTAAFLPAPRSTPDAKPERDVSTHALIFTVALILAGCVFFLVWPPVLELIVRHVADSLLKVNRLLDRPGPAPLWARIAFASLWSVVTYRRFVQHRQRQMA